MEILAKFVADWAGNEGEYLGSAMADRLLSRLQHIFALRDMSDAYAEAAEAETKVTADADRVAELKNFIETTSGPLFARVHMMGTHGPNFQEKKRVFSVGREQTEFWMDDFYDDAILQFDGLVNDIVQFLKEENLLDDTILVITSDHGQLYSTTSRIPLLFRFPKGAYQGVIRANAQLFDIGPTLLDYLDIPKPEWMRGDSLINGPLANTRPIWSSIMRSGARTNQKVDYSKLSPPFFLLGSVEVTVCDRHVFFDVLSWRLTTSRIKDHTAPCQAEEIIPDEEVFGWIYDHLRQNYDVPLLLGAPVVTRKPSAEAVAGAPLRLEAVYPGRTSVGVGFNVQPNGESAIALRGSGFEAGAEALFDGDATPATFGNSGFVSAPMSAAYYTKEGIVKIAVRNPDGQLSNTVDFEVATGVAPGH